MLERSQLSIYARVTLIWGYPVSPKYPINIIRRRPPTFQASIFLLQSTHGLYSFCTLLNFWGHRNVCIGPQRFWQWWGWRLIMVRNMRSIYGFIKKKKKRQCEWSRCTILIFWLKKRLLLFVACSTLFFVLRKRDWIFGAIFKLLIVLDDGSTST